MTKRKSTALLIMVVATVGGLLVLYGVLSPQRASTPGASDEPRGTVQERIGSMPGIRRVVGGGPRVTGCRDRERDRLCRIEGPTGLRAVCFLPMRDTTIDASCSRFESP